MNSEEAVRNGDFLNSLADRSGVGVFIVIFRLKPWRIDGDACALREPRRRARRDKDSIADVVLASDSRNATDTMRDIKSESGPHESENFC